MCVVHVSFFCVCMCILAAKIEMLRKDIDVLNERCVCVRVVRVCV